MIKLTEDEWFERFEPLFFNNDNYLLETYGDDLKLLQQTDNNRIWTLIDVDGKLEIIEGYHIVNRMNYIITKKPYLINEQYQIKYE